MRTAILIAGLILTPFALPRGGVVSLADAAPLSDTVIDVRAGDRVHVRLSEGRVVVEGSRNDLLSADDDGDPDRVRMTRRGDVVVVEPLRRGDDPVIRLRVPAGLEVAVMGEDVDVVVADLAADVSVRVVEGDVRARSVAGSLELRTVSGDIDAEGIEGDLVASTVDGRVGVIDVTGNVTAESMHGDVTVEGVGGGEVHAVTVDGDVVYRGDVRAGGWVRLVTHDGDVSAEIPEGVSADVEVSTYDGEFLPAFPVRVGRVEAGKPLRFRMGSGGARLELQAFDGDIQLRHGPGR